jgi:hypothetical protein
MFFSKLVVVLFSFSRFSNVDAHYVWHSVDQTAPWDVVRRTDNYQSQHPIMNVNDINFRCYSSGRTAPNTYTVQAGSQITFNSNNQLYHIGVANVYMAKAPGNAVDFDGSGNVWFKVFEITAHPDPTGNQYPTFPSSALNSVTFTIPKNLPSGEYLLRPEHIALHDSSGGAQFYISCAQIRVINGGNGTPGPLVSIPGVYSGNEPGIKFNPYTYPKPTSYIQPGPAVWSG